MPKVVDHEARRRELAEAVWRIVRRDGIDHASVRAVAAESGWSSGSLRHYFPTQDSLLGFAMQMAFRRLFTRLEQIDTTRPHREITRRIAHELLALDEERETESAVLISFVPRALVEPGLHELERTGTHALYDRFAAVFRQARDAGELEPGLDPAKEARRTVALIDGLNLHHQQGAEDMPHDDMIAIVEEHLDRLFPRAD
ncbi:HTH-type transcriptional regulator PksA [Lentzea sp. NBRC 105346]|uniref:TetR/AcrR family transcriptional regulator n=1 Tax=Lentzea sp. NBRC 105346 TaxID=3032205 RepID=UPI00255503AF|nr:TetR family transcriptional regulator C-terminal domain-containing protein [Lentzea sp. NBRC 105346]GLZ33986.1 HTH-type transcriptional regulator PksA [Lentzea sp. NBRC 105346]